jgi:NADH-quinone oxidoreductase subunit M
MLVNILILVPFITALLMLVLPKDSLKIASVLIALGLLGTTVMAYFIYKADASSGSLISDLSWIESIKSKWLVSLDGMSILMTFLATLICPIIFLSIDKKNNYSNNFYALVWIMIGAMIGVFTAKDGLLFYVFWELALIPIYFICLIWGGENRGKITFKFFLYTLFGSLFMLAALLYLYQKSTGGWEIGALNDAGRSLTQLEQNLVFWALFLGFAIKMPVFPFHTWQPDTYNAAPTQGTMLLSGIMLKMGTYGAIRWLLPMVPAAVAHNSRYVIMLSIIGIVYASCIALMQKDAKRLMAWSSIAHVGLISAGIFAFNNEGIKGAFVQMLSHGINVVGCFFIVDIIMRRMKTDDMTKLGGIRGVAPVFGLLFLIVLLGSVALPLTNGFVGEFLLINGVFQYDLIAAIFAGLTVILGAVYMLRAYQSIMLGETNALTSGFHEVEAWEKWTLIIIAGLIIFFGLFPNVVLDLIAPGVDALLNNNISTKEIIQ